MKNLLILLSMFISMASLAQSKKWYLSLSAAYGYSGTRSEIKNEMSSQNFNEGELTSFFSDASKPYPFANPIPSFLLNAGKAISKKHSIFLAGGLLDHAYVSGRKSSAPTDVGLEVHYNLFQLTAGIVLPFAVRGRFGIGASLLSLSYFKRNATYPPLPDYAKNQTITGGLYNFLALPLGNGKKSTGLELFMHSNLSPKARMEFKGKPGDFTMEKVSIINVAFGLAMTYQKKAGRSN